MINRNDNMDQLLSAIQQADSVLLFSHISPDGDTLGSTLALNLLLKRLGKRTQLILDGETPDSLSFLPGCDGYILPRNATPTENALAISVDVSCDERLGTGAALYHSAAVTAVIDHHETNDGFGQINWIDGDAPATAILIHRLQKALKLPIMPDEAVCLYTALATDTGNFVYKSVNAETFIMMADLMDAGLVLSEYSRILFRQKRESFVRLLGATLPSLRVLADGKVAGLRVGYEQMCQCGANPAVSDGVVDYAIDLKGVRMAYFAHENEDGTTKVSFRALAPYRIDQAAAIFGGGGHQLAAGCTIAMPVEQAAQAVEQALLEAYAQQKSAL